MYQITHNTKTKVLEINNKALGLEAIIHLSQGASLQKLALGNHKLIVDLHPLVYKNTYASAILFPFANRIKDGAYSFNGQAYTLEINEPALNNALHGLVYNKLFEVVDKQTSNDSASVKLEYTEPQKTKGFPFTYKMLLEYVFTSNSISINIEVKNTDSNAFPFTLGWHPYFQSKNLYDSSLNFDSDRKVVMGDRNITKGMETIKNADVFDIKDKQLDDCWELNSNTIQFNTPDYKFKIVSSEENNFLQVYTPPKQNNIAIEPTTGVSDSFNNNIGLKTLNPNEVYTISWYLKLMK